MFMARIAESAERHYPHGKNMQFAARKVVEESVAYASCVVAEQLEAAAIVATTRSGTTAMRISRFKPKTPIIALSPDPEAIRRLTLYWGCFPHHVSNIIDTDEMVESATRTVLSIGDYAEGDLVVITAGRPVWEAGSTNMLWVKRL